MGPIHPDALLPPACGLPKSRTINMLSSLTSSFSRSNLHLTKSSASSFNLASKCNESETSPMILPEITTDILHVSCPKPTAYWIGRYMSLHDRFRSEYLTPDSLDEANFRQVRNFDPYGRTEQGHSLDGEKMAKRVFDKLDTFCLNNEARMSLRKFQQGYARQMQCEGLLPQGGCMDDKTGIIAKAGRLFSGGRKSSFGSTSRMATGRKTSQGKLIVEVL